MYNVKSNTSKFSLIKMNNLNQYEMIYEKAKVANSLIIKCFI